MTTATTRSGPPPGPRTPRAIQGLQFGVAEHALLERCQRRYGDIFTINVWPFERLVVIGDPAEIKRLFTGDPALLHAGEGNSILEPVVGPHSVLLLDESAHLHTRKLMLPPFHGERMREYGELMREIANEEIDRWPVGEPFGLHRPMQAITLEVILRAVFGIDDAERLAELEPPLLRMLDAGRRSTVNPALQLDLGPRSPWGRFIRARDDVDAILFPVIRQRRTDPGAAERSDVLSMLLQARDDDGRPMSDVELRDQLITLLIAGHETTASSMAWVFERVLRHPPVLARLRREIAHGGEGYLDSVIKETMRTRPVLTFAMRTLTAPREVGGYTVPAGHTLAAGVHLIHKRADLYPDPLAFRPERFEERPVETYSWVPFGGGVRRCLGAAFATYEMKVVLRTILERCELSAPDQRPERRSRRSITFVPAHGTRVVMRERRPAFDEHGEPAMAQAA